MFLRGLWNRFYSICRFFWVLCWLFCVNQTYICQDTDGNVSSLALKPVLSHVSHLFEHFGSYFSSIRCTFAMVRMETFFHKLWNLLYGIRRTFWSLWSIFFVDWMYHCEDTGINVSWQALNPVLQHSLHFFEHFGCYFASIGRTVVKIWA